MTRAALFLSVLALWLLSAAPAAASQIELIEKLQISGKSGQTEVTLRVSADGRAGTPAGGIVLTPQQLARLGEIASAAMSVQTDDTCRQIGNDLTKYGFRIYAPPNTVTVTYFSYCRLLPAREALRYELDQLEQFLNNRK